MAIIKIKNKEYSDFKIALETIDINNKENIDIFINGIIEGQNIINRPNIVVHGGTFKNNYGGYEILSDGKKRGTFNSYTLYVSANNIKFVDTKILNEAGSTNGQAIALMIDGDNIKLNNCEISSYQDTLFIGPLPEKEFEVDGFKGPLKDKERIMKHVYLKDCVIKGSVDFIFGSGFAYFYKCIIESLKAGYVLAPSTKEDEKYGFILDSCNFVSQLKEECAYLGRPWRNGAKAMITNCRIGSHIYSDGYTDWNKDMSRVSFKEDGDVTKRRYVERISDDDYLFIKKLRDFNF